jgi:hypothetical protein
MPGRNGVLRIIVLGYVVRMPIGGLAWHYLQYVLGLARAGHDVYYVEDSRFLEEDEYDLFYDPEDTNGENSPAFGLSFASDLFDRFGLGGRWAFYNAGRDEWQGPAANGILKTCQTADVLLNVSAVNPLRPWLMQVPHRIFIDTDPAFSQVRNLTNAPKRRLASRHTDFFSFGENIASGLSTVPKDGFLWKPARQPVVMDVWPVQPTPPAARFTSVIAWTSYWTEEYDGVRYGHKSDSFSAFLDLPRTAGPILEMAFIGPAEVRQRLLASGWAIVEGTKATRDPWSYQSYLAGSKGEFGIAKQGYVTSRCGWFSERSANYLASGRPVVVQDTGFTDWMQTGAGVLPFTNPDEAVAAIEEVSRRYEYHCRAAREVAEEYFDSDKVLNRLIEAVYAGRAPGGLEEK